MNPPCLAGEAWRETEFPNYWVSSLGRVWSGSRRPGLLKIRYDATGGYGYVRPTKADGRQITQRVHVLVAKAFLGPKPPGMEILHADDDKTNNAVSNLRYDTRSENLNDRVRNGIHHHAAKTRCKNNHEFTPENTRIALRVDGSFKQRVCLACQRESNARRYT